VEVLVVAERLAGEEAMHGVMKVIRPVGVHSEAAVARRQHQARIIQIALGNHDEAAAERLAEFPHGGGQLLEHVQGVETEYGVNRVEPQVVWTSIDSEALFSLQSANGKDSGLRCAIHYLTGRYPKYVKSEAANLARDEATAALFFASAAGKRVAYIPAVGSMSDALLEKIRHVDLLLFDGTFWSDDELARVLGSGETAHQMGHIPVEESLRLLKNIEVGRKMFIHLKNTNPILNEASREHQVVRQAGWEVAEDNWQVEL